MRNSDYLNVLESLAIDIAKGRVGVCGTMNIAMDLKGSEHDFNRHIRKLQKAFEAGKENFKLTFLSQGGCMRAFFTSPRFKIEVRNS